MKNVSVAVVIASINAAFASDSPTPVANSFSPDSNSTAPTPAGSNGGTPSSMGSFDNKPPGSFSAMPRPTGSFSAMPKPTGDFNKFSGSGSGSGAPPSFPGIVPTGVLAPPTDGDLKRFFESFENQLPPQVPPEFRNALNFSAPDNSGDNNFGDPNVKSLRDLIRSGRFNVTNISPRFYDRKIERNEFINGTLAIEATREITRDGSLKSRNSFRIANRGVPRLCYQYKSQDSDSEDLFRACIGFLNMAEVNTTVCDNKPLKLILHRFPADMWTPMTQSSTLDSNNVRIMTVSTSLVPRLTDPNGGSSLANLNAVYINQFVGLNLTVTAQLSSSFSQVQSVQLHPDSLKYTLTIQNWPQKCDNSKFVITKGLRTTSDHIEHDSGKNDTVAIAGGLGTFNWESKIMVNGTEQEVKINPDWNLKEIRANSTDISSDLKEQFTQFMKQSDFDGKVEREGSSLKIIAFEAPMGAFIEWDPQFGGDSVATNPAFSTADTTTPAPAPTSGSNATASTTLAAPAATSSVPSKGNFTVDAKADAGKVAVSALALFGSLFALLL